MYNHIGVSIIEYDILHVKTPIQRANEIDVLVCVPVYVSELDLAFMRCMQNNKYIHHACMHGRWEMSTFSRDH